MTERLRTGPANGANLNTGLMSSPSASNAFVATISARRCTITVLQ